ncbi:hypothetical protein PDIDSM_1902 [Penicillium digitatum]|nr:hypothetical protein PDIDSM_1902 [Penicillium digitatum]
MSETFTIHYFATASQYTSKNTESLPAPLKLSALFGELEQRYPGIVHKVLSTCGVSLNGEYVDVQEDEEVLIQAGGEVAVIPPLSDDFKQRVRTAYKEDPKWSLVLNELQRVTQDPDPIKPRLPYETDDGLLYSTQADGDRWLCIPEAIKDDIFEMAHGDGHLGFHRAWQKMRGFVIHKGAKKPGCISTSPILAPPIPFHTLTIDFVTGLPRTKKGFDAVAIYTCKSTKRIGSDAGKKPGAVKNGLSRSSVTSRRATGGSPWCGSPTGTSALFKASEGRNLATHWQNIHQEADWDEGLAPMQASLNASVNVSTGDSPHKLMFGVDLRMPWNLLRQAFVGSPQASRQDADECAKYAAMVMKKQYDSRHKPIFFQKNDFVYLRLAQGTEPGYVWPSRNITRKLTQRHIKCRVIERVGRLAYRLQMPPELAGAHPVVSLQHLERAPQEGDLSSAEPPSTFDPRFPEDTDRADVDAVLDMRHRGRGRGRRKQYLVRWSGVGNEHLEWLDEDNLVGAEEKVLEYLQDVLHHTQEFTN